MPAAAQQQPSGKPLLRIETGVHAATIYRAAADGAAQFLATASEDKTIRLWSLATGELRRILRPPIGDGEEGKLFAVAVSPDGNLVAAAGSTGLQWDGSHSIYLFDAASGRLVRRITGFPRNPVALAWSPDGHLLAVDFVGKGEGVVFLRTDDWQVALHDTDYDDAVRDIDFDRSGRVATSTEDGLIVLYGTDLHRLAKVKTPNGARAGGLAFSPDGNLLAIGYAHHPGVDVLSASDLRLAFEADTRGVIGGNLHEVAWTRDGALLAGGSRNGTAGFQILRWPQGGRGAREVATPVSAAVNAMIGLGNGGFAYVAFDGTIGAFDAQRHRVFERTSQDLDLINQPDGLFLSQEALVVGVKPAPGKVAPIRYSIVDRRLEAGDSLAGLAAPDRQGLPLTDWRDSWTPRLAGKLLLANPHEYSRSTAVAADHRSLLLGTTWFLRRFDAAGVQSWAHFGPSVAWAINLSRDGRLAVVAYGDGTIRWFRYADGKELLALFIHKDGRRWVLWTPDGYYDAAPGAEDLIGWHVNRGADHEADFFPASRFRKRFYRPEVVYAVLRTLDIDAALQQAGVQPTAPLAATSLPPVIKILSPQEGAPAAGSPVQIRYLVRSPSGEPVTEIEVKVDGRPLPGDRGTVLLARDPAAPQAEREGTLSVPIAGEATITLVARAGERRSEAANVHVAWQPSAASAPAPSRVPKPLLYVLAVGISRYQDPDIQLHYAAKDAGDVAAAWTAQQGGLYGEVVTKILRDDQATRDAILDGLDWIERVTSQRDVALVLMSGHGENDADGAYYFLPYDVEPDRLRRTAIPDIEIRRSLAHVAGKALFFFDTCHAGSVMPGKRAGPTDINGFVNDLTSAENGLVVFAASTGKEFAQERDEWQNGAFTKALIEGLSGKADLSGDGVITISELEYWLGERVKQLTDGRQHPTTAKPSTIQDFPIATVRRQ